MISNYIQNLFIILLNPVFSITRKISEGTRNFVIQVLYVGLFGIYIAFRAKIFKHALYRELLHDASVRYIFCTAILLIVAILTINAPLRRIKWRKSIVYSQILTGIGIIVISFLHPIGAGYRLFGFQLLFVFPMFFFIWNNRKDYGTLLEPIVNAVSLIGVLFYLGTYYMAFKGRLMLDTGTTRLAGVMPNSNSFSLIGMELVLCSIYLLISKGGKWINTIVCGVLLGMGLGIVIQGQMRIAILTIILCSIFSAFFAVRYFRNYATKMMLIHAIALFVLAGIMIQLTARMVEINSWALLNKEGSIVRVEEASGMEKEANDSDITDRIINDEGADLNTYTSGRMRIWQEYIHHLNWTGNNFDNYDPVQFTGHKGLPYAHNIYLEIAYRCGIPIGLMAVLYYVICGIICIKFLFIKSNKKQLYQLFPIIAAIAFALEALLDCAVLPFFQAEALLFYIAIAVMIDKDVN